jgi:hypothetical protein
LGVIWFLYIIFDLFAKGERFLGWPNGNSLEWRHLSPPLFHTYEGLPFVFNLTFKKKEWKIF